MQKIQPDSRVCWWLLIAYVLIAPLLPFTNLPISWDGITLMDWQRIFEVATLFCCMTWAIAFAPTLRIGPIYFAWAAIFLLGLISALAQASSLISALLEWSWLLVCVLLATMMHQWGVTNRQALDKTLLTMAFIAGLTYVWWFWQLNGFIYFEAAPEGITRTVNFPGFSNIRFFSDYQSFILLLLPTALYRLTTPGIGRLMGTWIVALYFALALIAGSRSLLMAHFILHASMWLLFRQRYWPFLLPQLRFWLYGGLVFLFLTQLLPVVIGSGGNRVVTELARIESSGRTTLWELAWNMIMDHPLLGIGPQQFANHANHIASSPHNFVIQIATEWGLPAAALLVWAFSHHIFGRLQPLRSSQHQKIEDVPLAMICAAIATLLQSLVSSGPMNYPVVQVMALVFFAYPQTRRPDEQCYLPQDYKLQVSGLVAMAMCALALPPLSVIQERNQCFSYHPWPTDRFAPRFWQQGWLTGPCGKTSSMPGWNKPHPK